VAEASNADGRVELFGIDKTGRVFHRWQQVANDDTSWSPWAELTGQQLTSLAVARNDNGTLELFGTTPSGQIFTRTQVLSRDEFQHDQPLNPLPAIDHWTDWQQMDGRASQVAAGVNANGRLELFGLDSTRRLFDREQTAVDATDPSIAGSWMGWSQLPGQGGTVGQAPLTGQRAFTSIAVASDLAGSLNVFGTDSAGTVSQSYQQGQNTEQWSPWTAITGPAMSNLAAAAESGGGKRLDQFATDRTGRSVLQQRPDLWDAHRSGIVQRVDYRHRRRRAIGLCVVYLASDRCDRSERALRATRHRRQRHHRGRLGRRRLLPEAMHQSGRRPDPEPRRRNRDGSRLHRAHHGRQRKRSPPASSNDGDIGRFRRCTRGACFSQYASYSGERLSNSGSGNVELPCHFIRGVALEEQQEHLLLTVGEIREPLLLKKGGEPSGHVRVRDSLRKLLGQVSLKSCGESPNGLKACTRRPYLHDATARKPPLAQTLSRA